MIKRLIRIILSVLLLIGIMSLGGYTVNEIKHTAQIKNPSDVFAPFINSLPNINTPNLHKVSGNSELANTSTEKQSSSTEYLFSTTESPSTITTENNLLTTNNNKHVVSVSTKRTIKVTIDGKSMELTSENTISFIKWISTNYDKDSKVAYKETTKPDSNENTTEQNKNSNESITYNKILANEKDLQEIVDSIIVVNSLKDLDDYDRTDYEKPIKSYTLNGHKYNRNDYAWKTSPYLISENPFKYICPYTGQTITDDSKLDYDHIIPLKSTYIRGANKWTDEQKNEYAYDQWIGVDVLNSANRSKSDKGPADWLPEQNVEDYCYSWLLISSKYNLVMTKAEMSICIDNIKTALKNGETVEHLNNVVISK